MQLDNYSKIIIATGSINYMASGLNSLALVLDMGQTPGARSKALRDKLETVAGWLAEVHEDLADFLNNHDILCPLDERVLKVPSEILVLGMDETDENYEQPEEESVIYVQHPAPEKAKCPDHLSVMVSQPGESYGCRPYIPQHEGFELFMKGETLILRDKYGNYFEGRTTAGSTVVVGDLIDTNSQQWREVEALYLTIKNQQDGKDK